MDDKPDKPLTPEKFRDAIKKIGVKYFKLLPAIIKRLIIFGYVDIMDLPSLRVANWKVGLIGKDKYPTGTFGG